MVLRSEKSLKSKMPSLVRTSKYVNDTNIKKVRRGQLGLKGLAKLDSYCSDKRMRMLSDQIVVSNKTFMQFERVSICMKLAYCKYNVYIQAYMYTMKW